MTNNAERELIACRECGMPVASNEYHPYAACLMFRGCLDSEVVRANLSFVARAQASGVPDGWRLAPDKMTIEMFRAWKKAMRVREQDQDIGMNDVYVAMLAAAPTPPKSACVPVERLEGLLESLKSVPVNQEWIYGALEELVAEYKS